MNRFVAFSCFAVAVFAMAVQAQSVISARSGTIHYVEGTVLLNDQQISPKFGEFPAMENGAVLRTTDQGRVEVLLTPGAILRVGESSSIRMVANSLSDTRVELQTGKAVLECADILKVKGDAVTMLVGGKAISFAKDGIYEMTAEPPSVQVYKGEATVLADGKQTVVKRGHEELLGSVVTAEKFDDNATDDLYNWSSRRSGYLALANVSAASMTGTGGYGNGFAGGGWAWNPYFGMFTMVPMNGMLYSPFGYGFYSPFNYYQAYYPYYYGNGYGGYYGGGSPGASTYAGRPATQPTRTTSGVSGVSGGRMGGGSSSGSTGGGTGGGGGVAGGRAGR